MNPWAAAVGPWQTVLLILLPLEHCTPRNALSMLAQRHQEEDACKVAATPSQLPISKR